MIMHTNNINYKITNLLVRLPISLHMLFYKYAYKFLIKKYIYI